MTTDSTSLDVESTDHDQHAQSEHDPLLGNDLKVLTKQEARSAHAQFLALCWTLFVVGWCDGSTGPLLPRIQKFYEVSWSYSFEYFSMSWIGYEFCRSGLKQCLGYLFCILRSAMVVGRCQLPYAIFQGAFVGAMINIPLNNKLGLGRVSIQVWWFFFKLHVTNLHFRYWWSGLSSRLRRFSSTFLHFLFRFSLYPLLLIRLERYFRLVLYISIKELYAIMSLLIRSSLRLRMASLLHFKETLNTKWVAYMLHTVRLFLKMCY